MANAITSASQDSSKAAARLMITSSQIRPVTARPPGSLCKERSTQLIRSSGKRADQGDAA
jgi:hypothetical protein